VGVALAGATKAANETPVTRTSAKRIKAKR
jgi:hypothetical protein